LGNNSYSAKKLIFESKISIFSVDSAGSTFFIFTSRSLYLFFQITKKIKFVNLIDVKLMMFFANLRCLAVNWFVFID